MKMKYIAVFLCLLGLVLAQGYTDWQQGAAEGLKVGFKMGQAYANSGTDVAGFNAQVDIYNAWVREHFGEDPMLLMQKLDAPVDLTKPVLVANNTTQGGIVHAIDGSNKATGASYTTNDMNLIPGDLRDPSSIKGLEYGGQYLPGV
jgi:hypothetical protein